MDQVNPLTLNIPATNPNRDAVPEVPPVMYTDLELKDRSNKIARMMQARFMRDRNHPELDNMTYLEYYESNRRKDLSYLIPKKNRQDVRIVTGTTREKDSTLLSTLLDMNMSASVVAFDKDNQMHLEFGDTMSDLNKKSREIEDWSLTRPSIYRELIAQGDVFVQELHVEEFRDMPVHKMDWNPIYDPISNFSVRRRLEKVFSGCRVRMVNGKKVYLGNIRAEYMKKQPMAFVLNVLPRTEAASIYGQWERWKHVPYKFDTVQSYFDDGKTYKDWNLVQLSDYDKVAEIMFYDPILNEFQIFLNGVMMLPIKFPLTYISASGEIPITQGKFEVITDFCYGKSQPAKTKIDQEVKDELVKLMIEKTRQSFKPPLGNTGDQIFSDKIFMAGQVTPNLRAGQLFSLMPEKSMGVQPAEFSFYKLISDSIDEKSVSKNFQGDGNDTQTATEAVQDKNQQMMKIGLAIDGVVNLEKGMTWQRLYNIIEHWTKDDDGKVPEVQEDVQDAYKELHINDASLSDGSSGSKVYRFTTGKFPDVGDQHQEEENMAKEHGRPVRITYINSAVMRKIKWNWFIQIQPNPKSSDKLSQMLFTGMIQEAINMFGPESLQMDYVKQRWATVHKESYDKMFTKAPMGLPMPGAQPPQGQSGGGPGMPNGPTPAMAGGKSPLKAAMGQ